MLSKKMNKRLNDQITLEFASSYLYRQMASWFSDAGLTVLEQYYVDHADEERMHALKLLDYVQKAGGKLRLGAVDAPAFDYKSAEDVVAKTLKHEQHVTACIHALVGQAEDDKDYSTRSYLQWYIDEQVEEEAGFTELLQLTKLAGDHLLLLEQRVEKLMVAQQAALAGP